MRQTGGMLRASALALLLLAACNKTGASTPPSEGLPPGPPARDKSFTAAECEAEGGTVVGDIGNGAIHQPDYTCENGEPPLGDVTADEGGPMGVEGSVCCGS